MVKKKKKQQTTDASVPDAPMKFPKQIESTEERRGRFLKSQGRDIKATGKEAEDQLRVSKGLKPHEEVVEPAKPVPGFSEAVARIKEKQESGEIIQTFAEKQAESAARIEGRVPLDELPVYQQVLFGVAAAGGAGAGTVGGVASTQGIQGRTAIAKSVSHIKAVNKLSLSTGKDPIVIQKMVNNQLARKGVAEITAGTSGRFLGLGTKGKVAVGLGFGTIGVGALGADAYLFNWYAVDNVIGGIKINSNKVVSDFQFSGGDPGEAIAALEGSKAVAEAAANKVRASSRFNPLMWPQRNLVLAGVNEDLRVIDNNILKLQNLQAGGSVTDNQLETFEEEQPQPIETQDL